MKTYQIPVPTFDLDHTLRCGQVFRWRESKDGWIDIVIKAKQEGDVLIVKSNLDMEDVMSYFRLSDEKNYRQIQWFATDQTGPMGMPDFLYLFHQQQNTTNREHDSEPMHAIVRRKYIIQARVN